MVSVPASGTTTFTRSIEDAARAGRRVGTTLVGPAVLVVIAVNILPAFFGFYSSLRKIFFFGDEGFAGLDNFRALFADPVTWEAIGRSLIFTFGALALAVPLALLAALAVRELGARGRILLTILLVPWAMSPIVVALLWKWILLPSPGGLFASILATFGMPPANLLSNPTWAMPTVIAVAVWRTFAFAAIILTAGLGQIPKDLYKAAAVDGLTAVERFSRITVPLLAPSILIVLSMLTISYFNEVQVIIGLTSGGPIRSTTTLAYQLYLTGFVELDQGRGNAIAVVMFLINLVLIVGYVQLLGNKKGGEA
ncbi:MULTISPECIES: sugar ABC transporter permease [unclassified Chelatococcus]|jgi:ABC-type sugar transport system permease subunit|uniref:carbohydrate ABC transporter permease n=1 Tax=unclassified Chelatococcus TaxID=2638111 RepID=UPI001BD0F9CF|nr:MULTISPECIES: sugar ABC transporter permease [unclassified Chelatococcus]CAH1663147.1 Multiple sugar transport system permease protein [Hyphomicrobiales bacterium]MBS7741534.1 sugar ABC transporter permease [Chelatococcus sp. HY11]MBX3544447.1 sugar ABC transporter permease [Chelatococcus sp.]MCO5079030.1 sugar ABC transporter permease [Chelatococcus sp.]CAH1682370.1 Multiple sugar transport system permease protein [Hyphomicrobiales bacterium]